MVLPKLMSVQVWCAAWLERIYGFFCCFLLKNQCSCMFGLLIFLDLFGTFLVMKVCLPTHVSVVLLCLLLLT